MGRTPTPLTIWTTAAWAKRPEIAALADKGHTIVEIDALGPAPDLILTPTAHRWEPTMWETKLLDVALRAARARTKKERA